MLMPEPADKWRSERSGTDLARIDGIDNLVGKRKDRHVEALLREKFMLAGAGENTDLLVGKVLDGAPASRMRSPGRRRRRRKASSSEREGRPIA
jgi:hypothetical protein